MKPQNKFCNKKILIPNKTNLIWIKILNLHESNSSHLLSSLLSLNLRLTGQLVVKFVEIRAVILTKYLCTKGLLAEEIDKNMR
jgi:hypothetical protein